MEEQNVAVLNMQLYAQRAQIAELSRSIQLIKNNVSANQARDLAYQIIDNLLTNDFKLNANAQPLDIKNLKVNSATLTSNDATDPKTLSATIENNTLKFTASTDYTADKVAKTVSVTINGQTTTIDVEEYTLAQVILNHVVTQLNNAYWSVSTTGITTSSITIPSTLTDAIIVAKCDNNTMTYDSTAKTLSFKPTNKTIVNVASVSVNGTTVKQTCSSATIDQIVFCLNTGIAGTVDETNPKLVHFINSTAINLPENATVEFSNAAATNGSPAVEASTVTMSINSESKITGTATFGVNQEAATAFKLTKVDIKVTTHSGTETRHWDNPTSS